MLAEAEHGPRMRIELAKRFEEQYVRARVKDAERPLVRLDGSRNGDSAVWYTKGGWVFWMLRDLLGHDAMVEARTGAGKSPAPVCGPCESA